VLDATLDQPVLRLHGVGEAEYAVGDADAGVGRAEGKLPGIVLPGEVLQAKEGKPTLDRVVSLRPDHGLV
jgi:hypothetical protein